MPMNDSATMNLKQRREALGLSQEQLGAKVGVDAVTVSRWERGESIPQRRFWPKLSQITSLPIANIIAVPAQPSAKRGRQ